MALPDWPLLATFLIASIILAVTPGPGVVYIVTRSMLQGRQSGLASVAGVAFGNFGNALAASLGLAALFAASSAAFTIVKYLGAAYLIYLGIQAIRHRRDETNAPTVTEVPLRTVFRDGLIVALFNPKTAIFFAAFLPQFISPGRPFLVQSIMLGALFVLIAAVSDSVYALAASAIARSLTGTKRLGRIGAVLGGATYMALGVATALVGERAGDSCDPRAQCVPIYHEPSQR
jgi:threonine/homoserine/homoserine lactone efflux protein